MCVRLDISLRKHTFSTVTSSILFKASILPRKQASYDPTCFIQQIQAQHTNRMASATAAVVTEDLRDISCCICMAVFIKPRMLPCLHTFCETCIAELAQTSTKCPLCRTAFTLPDGGAGQLPRNFIVEELVESHTLRKRAQQKSVDCTHQDCENESAPSTTFCSTCKMFMCEYHTANHARFKKFASHKIVSMADFASSLEEHSSELPAIRRRSPLQCNEHGSEDLRLFCQTCEKVICRDCALLDHRAHKYDAVETAVPALVQAAQTALGTTERHQHDLEVAMRRVQAANSTLETTLAASETAAHAFFERLVMQLRAREAAVIGELHTMADAKRKQLEAQQTVLECAQRSVQAVRTLVQQALACDSTAHKAVLCVHVSHRLKAMHVDMWPLFAETTGHVGFQETLNKELGENCSNVGLVPDCELRPTDCKLEVLSYFNDARATVRVCARNIMQQPVSGVSFKATISASAFSPTLMEIALTDNGDGTYSATVRAPAYGTNSVSVLFRGKHVSCSPATLLCQQQFGFR